MKKMSVKTLISLILVVVSTVLVVISASVTLAKYARTDKDDEPVTPKSFYFESDLLGDTGNAPQYYVGTNEIRVDVMTYADELRVSEVDVTYKLTLTEQGSAEPMRILIPEQPIAAGTKTPTQHLFSGLEYGKTYILTASATAPYTKTLTATFTVYDERNSVSYTVYPGADDVASAQYGDNIVYVEVKTNEILKNVSVYWQNGYVPDNSYEPMADSQGTVDLNVSLAPYGTHILRFFKADSTVTYDPSKFFVEMVVDSINDNPFDSEIGDIEGDITDVEGEWQ